MFFKFFIEGEFVSDDFYTFISKFMPKPGKFCKRVSLNRGKSSKRYIDLVSIAQFDLVFPLSSSRISDPCVVK